MIDSSNIYLYERSCVYKNEAEISIILKLFHEESTRERK